MERCKDSDFFNIYLFKKIKLLAGGSLYLSLSVCLSLSLSIYLSLYLSLSLYLCVCVCVRARARADVYVLSMCHYGRYN